jgi:hypothetical protein
VHRLERLARFIFILHRTFDFVVTRLASFCYRLVKFFGPTTIIFVGHIGDLFADPLHSVLVADPCMAIAQKAPGRFIPFAGDSGDHEPGQ